MKIWKFKYRILNLTSKYLLFVLSILLLFSCINNTESEFNDPICGLASPLVFSKDSLTLHLSDYFAYPQSIERIIFPEQLSVIKVDSNRIRLFREENLPALSVLRFQMDDSTESVILVKNLAKQKMTISFDPGEMKFNEVKIKGSMNFWNAQLSEMKLTKGKWIEDFYLIPGEYHYVLLADGNEFTDPLNPDSVDNNIGGFNSVLKVGKYKQQELPFLRTERYTNKRIQINSSVPISNVYALWQNKLIESELRDQQVSAPIPAAAKAIQRSWIRVVACDTDGGISNDILVPLEFGQVVTESEDLTRFDRQTMILYFMMVDRFKNGDPSNDEPVDDPDILPKANYFGGDLSGVKQVLLSNYFTELGVNTIWLSPINQNPKGAYGLFKDPYTKFSGYHGYWPVSYKEIDYRFGTSDEFRGLVEATHAKNMNILIDYVANHVHELHPLYQQYPDWVTDLYLPDGTMNTERWEEYRLTTWFDTFLPKLDLRRPEVVNPLTDSALYWLTEFGVDGFRHDATKHIDEIYWRTLTSKLKEETECSTMPYQIGETYGSPELINSYIGSGMLDGQFDFNLYGDAVAVFARDTESFERLQSSLTQSLRYFGYHNQMGNISGNQDRPRFISLAGGDLRFDEDSKYAGWTREIGIGDSSAYDKLKMLHAFNLTIPGIPVIYYGDEYGMPGANDPDNRRMMRFSDLNPREENVRSTVQKLASLRSANMPLLFGDVELISCDESTFAYIRYYFNNYTFVAFNKSREPKSIILSKDYFQGDKYVSHFGSIIEVKTDTLIINLEPISFDIITNKE